MHQQGRHFRRAEFSPRAYYPRDRVPTDCCYPCLHIGEQQQSLLLVSSDQHFQILSGDLPNVTVEVAQGDPTVLFHWDLQEGCLMAEHLEVL